MDPLWHRSSSPARSIVLHRRTRIRSPTVGLAVIVCLSPVLWYQLRSAVLSIAILSATLTPHSGFAVFSVIESLIWPLRVEIRMHLLSPHKNETPNSDDRDRTLLQITVTNSGSDVISVQTRGERRFLSPWGPFQPESDDGLNAGRRHCILDPSSATADSQLTDVATGSVVRHPPKPGVCELTSGRPDLRPTVDWLFVLTLGIAASREI